MNGLLGYGYYRGKVDNWLNVIRRVKRARVNEDIPKEKRKYVKSVDELQVWVGPIFKDKNGKLYVVKENG